MNIKEIEKFIERQVWTFAKSMPKTPHEYIVKDNLTEEDKKIFEEIVQYIRDMGIYARFFRTGYIYLLVNDHYYWTMGSPIEETIILNRSHINNSRILKIGDYYRMEVSENVLL